MADAGTIAVWWVVAVSLVSFALAVFDKARAHRVGPRVPERVLLGSALIGGSPGLLLGMLVARHKTRKPSFIAGFLVVLAAQALVVWLYLRR